MRTWVSPTGECFDVSDESLYIFCKERGLHHANMVHHISTPTSDQKNGGWRLIERLCAIGHVERPHDHVLALGTLGAFHSDCLASRDGRAVLENRDNLARLLNNRYKGGKLWNQWECRLLTTAVKRQILEKLAGDLQPPTTTNGELASTAVLPDFASSVLRGAMDPLACAASQSTFGHNSTTPGSLQVIF